MSFFRRMMLVTLTVAALMSPLTTFTPRAQADHRQHQHYYYVYYRSCPTSSWYVYGGYTDLYYAEYVAYVFQYYGYETFIR